MSCAPDESAHFSKILSTVTDNSINSLEGMDVPGFFVKIHL